MYPAYVNYPFYIAGGLKILYDLLLLWSFQSVKPREELEPNKSAGGREKLHIELKISESKA